MMEELTFQMESQGFLAFIQCRINFETLARRKILKWKNFSDSTTKEKSSSVNVWECVERAVDEQLIPNVPSLFLCSQFGSRA